MKFEQNNKDSIKYLFNQIATNYDLLNSLMSLGLQQSIKKKSIKNATKKLKNEPLKILDLCTGTGDIAIECKKLFPKAEVIGIDFSENMLKIAKANATDITFIQQDITQLIPNTPLEENSFDICFISFGLRNLPNIDEFLINAQRYLKQDGILSILDLGKPIWFMKPYFFFHYHILIPLFATLFYQDITPYKYLIKSSKTYPAQKEIIEKLEKSNYKDVININYSFGIISQQIGRKNNLTGE